MIGPHWHVVNAPDKVIGIAAVAIQVNMLMRIAPLLLMPKAECMEKLVLNLPRRVGTLVQAQRDRLHRLGVDQAYVRPAATRVRDLEFLLYLCDPQVSELAVNR